MRIGNIQVKRRVWFGLGFALAVTIVWWVWSRTQRRPMVAAEADRQPFVQLIGVGTGATDQVLREQAELFDPKPLFFPTEWNFGQRPLRESLRRQPGEIFGSFQPKLDFGEQGIKAYGVEAAIAPERLVDVLVQGNEAPFAGMGQVDTPPPALEARSSFLEVRALTDGKTIIAQSLKGLEVPRIDFAPIEYLVAMSSAGIVGDPIRLVGSEGDEMDEKVDTFFRSYLVKTFRLGERLDPGRYRVLVGP